MFHIREIRKTWLRLRSGRESETRASRRRPRRRCGFEALEGRALLSLYVVDSPGDAGAGTGLAGDLRCAIEQANRATGDSTIVFAPKLDGRTIPLTSGMLTIDKPSGTLTIRGPGAGELSISGGQLSQVLAVTSSSHATIDGLTITGGAWPLGPGGGISSDGRLNLAGCTIAGNTDFGGGGGGIADGPQGTMTIRDSTISGNVACVSDGGGIANAGRMTVIQSTVSGDATRGGNGGGIVNTGTLTISDSTISGNRATIYSGGGIDNASALTLNDDTISDNSANFQGGGIANQADLGGTIAMDNTIVADNATFIDARTADVFDSEDFQGRSLVGSYDLVGVGDLGSLADTLVGVDPQLGLLQDNGGPTWTQAIALGSPAAGAGDPALLPAAVTTDQRGFPYARVVQGQLDIGAFEIQTNHDVFPSPPTPPSRSQGYSDAIIGLSIDPQDHPHGTS